MCLGIPGKVVRWICRDGILACAEVEFEGVRRVCHMACVPEAAVGDYVIVHAGIAISRIDVAEAESIRNQSSVEEKSIDDSNPLQGE